MMGISWRDSGSDRISSFSPRQDDFGKVRQDAFANRPSAGERHGEIRTRRVRSGHQVGLGQPERYSPGATIVGTVMR